ncbi:MAG: hypothetical protein J5563_00780, partial [Clostridia bacterium]|nr:hypothetical protein [Clostridia bacterium]
PEIAKVLLIIPMVIIILQALMIAACIILMNKTGDVLMFFASATIVSLFVCPVLCLICSVAGTTLMIFPLKSEESRRDRVWIVIGVIEVILSAVCCVWSHRMCQKGFSITFV